MDVHRLAERMGVALPAYISFRNSPVWTAPAVAAAIPDAAPAEDAVASAPVTVPEAAPAEPAEPAPAVIRAAAPHNPVPIPELLPPPAMRAAPARGYPLIEAALAARPAGH